nr:reverse transcriptase domain-containing protein [Tanacetum cinerariifolium]
MSDEKHSIVIYTSIFSDDGSSYVGSLEVIVLEYDGLLMMPKDLYAYVEAAMQEPPPPDFVLEPVYPEFMLPEDDVLSTEEQPLPAAVSPNADSPGYITESDLKEDLKEKDDKDPEEDPANYPTNIDYDEKDESSKDDANDEEEEKGEEELLAIPTPPPSPLTSYSSPLPQIPSPPLPTSPTDAEAPLRYRAAMIRLRAESPSTSHPVPLPPHIVIPRTIASMVMMRAAPLSTYILAPQSGTPSSGTPPLLPIPLPTSSPPLLLPSTDCKADVPEVTPTRGFRADYGFVGTLDVEIRRDPDREIDRRSHARTARLMESEARASCEAWVQSMDVSDMARSETQMVALQSQQRPAKDLAHPDVPEEKIEPTKRTTRASPAKTTTPVTNAQLKALIDQGVADALVAHDVDVSRNGDDSHNLGASSKRTERTAREMETLFNISNCVVENQVKFSTCTLHGVALTWCKSHVKIVGQDAAHDMPWNTLMKMMTAKYCPQNEIKKLEMEI